MRIKDEAARIGDMHPTRQLHVYQQPDGDMIVEVTEKGFPIGYHGEHLSIDHPVARVEFCTSGGRSRRTLQALVALLEAMKEDNEKSPQ